MREKGVEGGREGEKSMKLKEGGNRKERERKKYVCVCEGKKEEGRKSEEKGLILGIQKIQD